MIRWFLSSLAAAAALLLTSGPARAGTLEAPLDVRKDGEVKLAAGPAAGAAGDGVKIGFAVSAPTDVEVAILDAKGAVVRHLAAGLLGPNAPEPFKKDALAQEVLWDRRDDAGKPAAGGPFKARVSAGARPRLDKYAGFDGNCLPGIVGLVVGEGGELFVLMSESFRGGTEVRVLDKDGKYLRTIVPYAADTPKERMAAVGMLEIEGERLPLVHNATARTNYPLINGMHHQNMALSPKGNIVMVSGLGTMCEQGPPRHLLALHPEGGGPADMSFVGPQLRKGRAGMIGGAGEGTAGLFDHVAASPDGEWYYVSYGANSRYGAKRHGVVRLKWADKEAGALWLGKDEPGADDGHFNNPTGIAVDKAGNVYVCDHGNNRVMVFDKEGKLLGKFPVEQPYQIAVHPAGGGIYVMSCNVVPKWGRILGEDSVLRKFGPFGQGEPKELARLEAKGMGVMALDPTASPARLWIATSKGLCPVADKGASFEPGPAVSNGNSMSHPTYLAADPARNRALVYENGSVKVYAIDLDTGRKSEFCKGTCVATDREGNVYVMGGRDNAVYRFDPAGKPLAFSGLGSNKILTKGYRGFGPNMGMPGLCVDVRGNIYVSRNSNYGGAEAYGGRVDVYGPDGKMLKEKVLDGLGYGECGLGVDAAGNIYQGMNIKPADKPFPAAFMGKVPEERWTFWRGKEREAPWCYVYYNAYLWHWGSVFKFGPDGGVVYGQHPWNLKRKDYGEPKAADKLENAPAGAVSYRSAYLGYEVKVAGAQWRYPGCGIIPASGDGLMPDPGCACYNSSLAVDEYGRVFAPNPFRYSVEMLDTNGNRIARIGHYGNADSAGAGSKLPEPEIALAGAYHVSAADGKVFIGDASNHRVVVVKFEHAAEGTCAVP